MDSPNDSDHYVYKCSSLAIPSADTCYSSNWQLNQSLINKPLTHEPWPRMWSPRDTYFRSQFQRSFNGHSYYCCLSVDNKTGCRNCDTSSLTEKQLKLFNKLKTKYPKLSDDILIESMRKTREQLVNSGQSKGFNGLKIVEIINKISEYIDEEVLNEEEIDNKNDGQSHPSKCGLGSGQDSQLVSQL
ncbi:uncharacterized protein LOC128961841 [Oppia nitens]|uniref:uncharacterized protein LOC128961841 n=1 Tax=Oppia nitens TaxID=1686743 RepID=UPI0023D9DC10|nr:uncharacterized protein LOC128961841 [Oppia nitens]